MGTLRRAVFDRMMSREKSYRATLLGMHHGVDCALLTRAAAGVCGRADITSFLTEWLDERRPLVEDCTHQLAWFATHPEIARGRGASPSR
jgi:hypothetical protein